jgi:hypothetical protein
MGGIAGALYHGSPKDINETGLGLGMLLGAITGPLIGSRAPTWIRGLDGLAQACPDPQLQRGR